MNEKNRETLYNAITNLPDERIQEALPPRQTPIRSTSRKAMLPLAACLAAVALFGAWDLGLFGQFGAAGGGGETGEVYMSYAGPVFPLSALGEPDLTAERAVDFDFSPYAPREETYETPDGRVESWTAWSSKALVTDSYTLTNPADREQTVTLLYPFAADLLAGRDQFPALTLDGEAVEAALHVGPTAEGYKDLFANDPDAVDQTYNLADLSGWTSYRTLIEGGYLDRALESVPALDRPVTVYRLTDWAPPAGFEGDFLDLAVTYRPGETVPTVLTWGFNFGSNDYETGTFTRGCSLSLTRPEAASPALIVLSGDLGDCTVKAYADGGMETPLAGASWTLDRSETTLGEVFGGLAESYFTEVLPVRYGEGETILSALSPAAFQGLAARLLLDHNLLSGDPAEKFGGGMLEEVLSEAVSADRVCSLSFDVTLPAHGTAEVSAAFAKPASLDFVGEHKNRNGYDLVTKLGSPLTFTAQTASVSHLDWVELLDQDFGFDPEAGVTAVLLDPDRDHYFLEVVRRGDK